MSPYFPSEGLKRPERWWKWNVSWLFVRGKNRSPLDLSVLPNVALLRRLLTILLDTNAKRPFELELSENPSTKLLFADLFLIII